MRLDKYLADCGVGSRSEIKKQIRQGLVRVGGVPNPRPETQIDPNTAEVEVGGVKLRYREFIYLLLNKPAGYVSATWDAKLPTVLDLVPQEYLHFEPFPVGRLDIDTEGLCLLTNDGQLAHRLLAPSKHIPKTYRATVDGAVTEADGEAFLRGVVLDDGYRTQPARLTILASGEVSEIELVITEGKFHQVKRMLEAVGKRVTYLRRIAMNNLQLPDDLALGEVRELTEDELGLLEQRERTV